MSASARTVMQARRRPVRACRSCSFESDERPEEFLAFMGLSGELRAVFLNVHGDLLTARYWREIQARHRAGELMDIAPYHSSRRLGRQAHSVL